MDAEDLELFERSVRHAIDSANGPALDAALEELGWAEALANDPRDAIGVLFELQGETTAASGALSQVVLDALGASAPGRGVVLPALNRWDPPGTVDGDALHVNGLATADLATAGTAVVATEHSVDLVATDSLDLQTINGMDPTLGLLRVTGQIPLGDTDAPAGAAPSDDAWPAALARARLALSHELVGASRRMLELARTHARERIQFDRPIATFQAVRHRLAEALVAVEMSACAIDTAWLDGTPTAALVAKAVAGRQSRIVVRHGQQVLAGIGFTAEHPFQAVAKRTIALDGLLGTGELLTRTLGADVLRAGKLPPLLPL